MKDIIFEARLAYEENCIAKYDRTGRPSKPPIKGERMCDYAVRYGVSIQSMKDVLPRVEVELQKLGLE